MEKLKKFFREVWGEAKRAHWPNRQELLVSTSVVILILVVMGVYFFLLDLALSGGIRAILRALGIG
ncbi:preprotein translocase subunit SecE [Pseudothermotoga hypogea DSM 11164 = NBRC 106472]|uniref:Protein translocase subunit SecE n=1 Tax=Pseudothermotoga hypogea DSM 11164 = NBRC 106472 TaxID=1123384 RepID=A0A0X1KNN1_9THEM|nr:MULTISPECIES: preprotein translocase subunit SecE [Pseudothermotoga]AJC72908.1 preprotein translocase subunit SecE [Pseudothermotoga hypogea DSM 11164 = NBRC 106472]MDI6862474.1 preprotein translocase subunit SecE [Pseudothermotoga sp.]